MSDRFSASQAEPEVGNHPLQIICVDLEEFANSLLRQTTETAQFIFYPDDWAT